MFAIIQAVAAYSSLVSTVSKCDRRVTGLFNLHAGYWFSMVTLSPNVKYRMPVITMPGLRFKVPVMEPNGTPQDFSPGLNFNDNAYFDGKLARIHGDSEQRPLKAPIDRWRTFLLITRNVILAPFMITITVVGSVLCGCCLIVCAGCGGGACDMWQEFLEPLGHNIQRIEESDIEKGTKSNDNPDLEPASWAQFLLIHQMAWWGHASVRWEWRLASSIPTDMSAATIETTVADLELLALMFGMVPSTKPNVLAISFCGEMIVTHTHDYVGLIAYYRSGRENIQNRIWSLTPRHSSQWLQLCIQEAQRKVNDFVEEKENNINIRCQEGTLVLSDQIEDVLRLLARRRTIFDAQVQYSCGRSMWLFSLPGFCRALKDIWELRAQKWRKASTLVDVGPIGQGINSCSCVSCCRAWFLSKGLKEQQWALLSIETHWDRGLTVGHAHHDGETMKPDVLIANPNPQDSWSEESGKQRREEDQQAREAAEPCESVTGEDPNIIFNVSKVCWRSCTEHCNCGKVARALARDTVVSLEHSIAIAAVNGAWLSEIDDSVLRQASALLLDDSGLASASLHVRNVSSVIAYTESHLRKVRHQTGATNMWNTEIREYMSDFSPIAVG